MAFQLNKFSSVEQKNNIAREYINKLLPLFPEYGEFKISDIIDNEFESDSEVRQTLMDCQSNIEYILRQKDLIKTGRFNLLVVLTPQGRERRTAVIKAMSTEESFTSKCDRVIRYIVKKENRDIAFTSKEIAEALYIDVYDVELIAKKFNNLGLVDLSLAEDCHRFHVKYEAEIFARETSFEEQKNTSSYKSSTVNNISISGHNNLVNLGTMVDNVITNTVKLSEQGNEDVAAALKGLAEAVASAVNIKEEEKQEYIEQIKILSDEALKPMDQRLPKSTLKLVINSSLGALSAVGSAAEIWGTWGDQIKTFFGLG